MTQTASKSYRIYDWAGAVLGALAIGRLSLLLVNHIDVSVFAIFAALIAGLLVADLFSGLVHWAFDTWGTTKTWLVGPIAIRTFREHHIDPHAMLRHGFVETNGHNLGLAALPALAGVLLLDSVAVWNAWFLFFVALFVAMTSQIHKWAHEPSPSKIVKVFQTFRLIIPPATHRQHHVGAHTGAYCITVGWLNPLLDKTGFFRTLERAITFLTGAVPRSAHVCSTKIMSPER